MKMLTVFLLMVLASLAVVSTSFASDDDNRYRDDSSSVFAPGYLNAAKYQAEAIMNQQTPKKSLLDNIADYLQGKTEDKVEKAVAEKAQITPKLQQKQGTPKGKSNAQAASLIAAASSGNPNDIPAYIRNKVQEYLGTFGGRVILDGLPNSTGYSLTSANGKYYAAWVGGGPERCDVEAQVFDQYGTACSDAPTTVRALDGDYLVNLNSVRPLADGNVAVFWSEEIKYEDSTGVMSFEMQILDANAHPAALTPTTLITDCIVDPTIDDVKSLANGNIAVFWTEMSPDCQHSSVKEEILSADGTATSAAVTLTNAAIDGGNTIITTLDNGNTAVFWAEGDALCWAKHNPAQQKYSLKTQQVLDAGGNAITSSTAIEIASNDMPVDLCINNVTPLANGDIAVFWTEMSPDFLHSSIIKEILNADGSTVHYEPVMVTDEATASSPGIKVATIANGDMAIIWATGDNWVLNNWGLKTQIFGADGQTPLLGPTPLNESGDQAFLGGGFNVTTLTNGDVVLYWTEKDPQNNILLKVQIFAANSDDVSLSPITVSTTARDIGGISVTALPDGKIGIFWGEMASDLLMYTKMQVIQPGSNSLLENTVSLPGKEETINNISILSNGDMAVFSQSWTDLSFSTQILDSYGNFKSADALTPPALVTSLTNLGNAIIYNPNINPFSLDFLIDSSSYNTSQTNTYAAGNDVSGIFKALLADKGILGVNLGGAANPQIAEKIGKDSLKESAMAIPVSKYISAEDVEIAMKLSSILKNPTEDQKVILDAIKALLSQTDKIKEGKANKGASEELTKAENDLLNAVANILLAQAMPDLLKSGDMSNIKGIFQELDTQKKAILLEYAKSTKPYYDNMLKDLARNMAILQLKNILNSNMSKEQIEKLPPSELDKILDKIKKQEKKAFEEEYILQQEAKYRKTYLDPGKQKLEEDMKHMLKDFTGKINNVLKSSEKK